MYKKFVLFCETVVDVWLKGQLTLSKYTFTTKASIYDNPKLIYSCEVMSFSRLISLAECSSVSQFVKFNFMHAAFAYPLLSSHWGQTPNNKHQPNFPAILAFIMPGPDSLSLTPFLSLFKLSDKMYAGAQVEGSDRGVGRGGGGLGKTNQ